MHKQLVTEEFRAVVKTTNVFAQSASSTKHGIKIFRQMRPYG